MRITKKMLDTKILNVNSMTKHKVSVCYTQGCGVYLTIDNTEYSHKRRDGSNEGITNKKCYEILEQYDNEIKEECIKRGWLK